MVQHNEHCLVLGVCFIVVTLNHSRKKEKAVGEKDLKQFTNGLILLSGTLLVLLYLQYMSRVIGILLLGVFFVYSFKLFLKFMKEFRGDPQGNLARLFDRNDELHILGMGPFVISQFLAGGHPMDYAVIEDRMVDTMKKFNLIDVKVRSGTPNGYLYISAMCKKLLNDVFKKKIEENKERLGFEIDEDFGLVVVHEFFWEYYEFDSYDVLNLEEASGGKREEEESMATENLEQIGLLTQD